MTEQEQPRGANDVDLGRLGAVDPPCQDRKAGIAGYGDQRPDRDLDIHATHQARGGDEDDQERDRHRAVDHGAGVQLHHLAVEDGIAGLLRKPVAHAPHRFGDIGVAMRLGAVHNILVSPRAANR